jgi:hypothetical protein
VFKGYVDVESGNKVKYEPVEAFAGSLNSNDVDPTTGESRFIDDIINTNSETIQFYSNCATDVSGVTLLYANNLSAGILGHSEIAAASKTITSDKILNSLNKIFEKAKNANEK